MKKTVLLIVLTLAGIGTLSAQSGGGFSGGTSSSHAFYAELGGPGVILSANFDGRFNASSHLGWGYRAGIGYGVEDGYYMNYEHGYLTYYYTHRSYGTIPLGINYLFGKPDSQHTLEVGAGGTILTRKVAAYVYDDYYDRGNLIGHAGVSYRRQPLDGGFMWRASIMTIIGTGGDIKATVGISFGYAF
jgi:hypothetical protein